MLMLFANTCTTQSRQSIPGSRLSIIPPSENANISDYFSVVSEDDQYEMSIIEFPESGIDKKMQEIDSAGYAKMGANVIQEFELDVDGYTGKVLHVRSNPLADAVQVLFGDSTFYVLASTLFTKDDTKLYNSIIESYKSIKVNKHKTVDWDDFLTIDYPTNSTFKLIKDGCFPMKLIFNEGGVRNDSLFNQSSIWIQQYPNDGNFQNNQEVLFQFLSPLLSAGEVEVLSVSIDGVTTIAENKVYQFVADCTRKSEQFRVNAISLIKEEYTVFILTQANCEKDIVEIESFLEAMRFK